eukprot:CAMPEP_0116912830 /NCGR_PEP_ID=MMETSP0467-20121206/16331_1 /TAXON_ID=283647 /ORGANISM="Mesodinium pulex, Strain SPMC105" /LENGTH=175 /DNA_ID=CAMNT_0004588907 /DNA_START=124 /DNA_END=651 /DNA_ORIENTATION=-
MTLMQNEANRIKNTFNRGPLQQQSQHSQKQQSNQLDRPGTALVPTQKKKKDKGDILSVLSGWGDTKENPRPNHTLTQSQKDHKDKVARFQDDDDIKSIASKMSRLTKRSTRSKRSTSSVQPSYQGDNQSVKSVLTNLTGKQSVDLKDVKKIEANEDGEVNAHLEGEDNFDEDGSE